MNSNVEWKRWGQTDPLWGVRADPGKRKADAEPWTDDAFYETGASDWDDFQSQWRQYGFVPDSCLDIGCGAGRISRAIAGVVGQAHAIDVSPAMIDYARTRIDAQNIQYYVTNGEGLPLENASVTGAFSCLVFRHFDSLEQGLRYFADIHRVLAPGGSMMIEVPVYTFPAFHRFFSRCYSMRKKLGTFRANVKRFLIGRGGGKPFFRSQCYDFIWLQERLKEIGFKDVEVRIFPVRSTGESYSFVFGRKA